MTRTCTSRFHKLRQPGTRGEGFVVVGSEH